MDWSGRRVLVTGAGGFIGSHLTERLLALGAKVRAMVRSAIGYLNAVPGDLARRLEMFPGDIRDEVSTREAVAGIDTVFHLAGFTSVDYSYTNPTETIMTNVQGTLNLCNACRQEKVRRLVHASTAGVYGSSRDGLPIKETHPVRASNPYTASKLAADTIVESYHLSYGLPVSICRPFNAYGPRAGRFLVIPSIILQLFHSDTLKLGDLSPVRSFTYVDDVLRAFIRMAEEDGVVGEVVHFGSPRPISIGDLAHLIGRLMGKSVVIEQDASRLRPGKSDVQLLIADSSKARELLNWEPKVDLEEGLTKTIDWIAAGGYNNVSG